MAIDIEQPMLRMKLKVAVAVVIFWGSTSDCNAIKGDWKQSPTPMPAMISKTMTLASEKFGERLKKKPKPRVSIQIGIQRGSRYRPV